MLETIEAGDLWIGDRNFCTTEFIFNIESKQAFFLVRQHQNLPWTAESELVWVGHTLWGRGKLRRIYLAFIMDSPKTGGSIILPAPRGRGLESKVDGFGFKSQIYEAPFPPLLPCSLTSSLNAK